MLKCHQIDCLMILRQLLLSNKKKKNLDDSGEYGGEGQNAILEDDSRPSF